MKKFMLLFALLGAMASQDSIEKAHNEKMCALLKSQLIDSLDLAHSIARATNSEVNYSRANAIVNLLPQYCH